MVQRELKLGGVNPTLWKKSPFPAPRNAEVALKDLLLHACLTRDWRHMEIAQSSPAAVISFKYPPEQE